MIGREAEIQKLKNLLYDVPLLGATFVALTGEPGIGKTTLLKHFIQNLPDWADGFLVRFSDSRKDFFLQFARYLNSSKTSPSRISIEFHEFLEKRRVPFVLAIDDADLSSNLLLTFFDSLKTHQILLITALSGGNIPSYFETIQLKPWSPDEMKDFYRQNKGTYPSLATLVEMEELTGGNPGKCREFLMGNVKETREPSEEINEDDPERLKRRAYELHARGRFEEALHVFEKLLEKIESPRGRALLKLEIVTNWSLMPDDTMRILNSIDKNLLQGDEVYQLELLRAYVYSQKLEFQKTI